MKEENHLQIGEKLREVREKRAMTLKDVAAAAGVTDSMISQIERNRVMPALDTLVAIADALSLDMEYLFRDARRKRSVQIVRGTERPVFESGAVRYERLALSVPGNHEHGIESYLLTIGPGGSRGSHEAGHDGRELGLITEGSAVLSIGGQEYILEAGDSVSFDAGLPHVLKNAGKGSLKAWWVVTPPRPFTE